MTYLTNQFCYRLFKQKQKDNLASKQQAFHPGNWKYSRFPYDERTFNKPSNLGFYYKEKEMKSKKEENGMEKRPEITCNLQKPKHITMSTQ